MHRHDKPTDREILRELDIHGLPWKNLHGGYFADPAIASPLIKIIKQMAETSHPKVLVDLAGGTGYVLKELIKQNIDPAIRLVNIDLSGKQLFHENSSNISKIQACISDFMRNEIDSPEKRFLFIMRSAFHYFGKDGIQPFLQHLRSQMKKGEFFIHQTASFAFRRDACCINNLYEQMGTGKWYPTVRGLRKLIENTGWSVLSVSQAPKLLLSSDDLARRYGLSRDTVMRILKNVISRAGEIENVFVKVRNGFSAYLHYYIYTCVAV
jgi:hypothetical protein